MKTIVDPNIIDDDGLKLTFGSYWDGIYQIGLWPDVETQASVRHISDFVHRLFSLTIIYLGSSRNPPCWLQWP